MTCNPKPCIRIAVVDDHPLIRVGVARALRSTDGIEIIDEGTTAADAIRIAKEKLPDIILMGICIPGDGIEAVRAITSDCPTVKSIILTGSERDEHVMAALEAGARGYVLKAITGPEFVSVVQAIQRGEGYVTPALAARLLRQAEQQKAQKSVANTIEALTHREEQVIDLICRGLSNKEVARALDLSDKTVKHYMTSILQKLQARNRVEAVLRYRRTGAD